jgi:hypothetical protein
MGWDGLGWGGMGWVGLGWVGAGWVGAGFEAATSEAPYGFPCVPSCQAGGGRSLPAHLQFEVNAVKVVKLPFEQVVAGAGHVGVIMWLGVRVG